MKLAPDLAPCSPVRVSCSWGSLLAFWCAAALAEVDDWLWIAALGIVGDMADKAGFREKALARSRYGIGVLREATALINAARRSSSADARPAFALLLNAQGPRGVACGRHPETQTLLVAQAWRARLKNAVVLAANTGYRAGWVHFAARTAREVNGLGFGQKAQVRS